MVQVKVSRLHPPTVTHYGNKDKVTHNYNTNGNREEWVEHAEGRLLLGRRLVDHVIILFLALIKVTNLGMNLRT